jgi:hypothetical protein
MKTKVHRQKRSLEVTCPCYLHLIAQIGTMLRISVLRCATMQSITPLKITYPATNTIPGPS